MIDTLCCISENPNHAVKIIENPFFCYRFVHKGIRTINFMITYCLKCDYEECEKL